MTLSPCHERCFMTDFATLLDAHIRAQGGCYVSGVDPLPDGGRYLWSAELAEPSLNLAVGTLDVAAVRAAAAARGRMPALLTPDPAVAEALAAAPGFAAAFPTAWMRHDAPEPRAPLPDGFALELTTHPSAGFCTVARQLFADPAHNAAAEPYVAVVCAETMPAGVKPHHLVLRDGAGTPVAAASLYGVGDLAGLYNVGTIAARQGQGLGRAITRAAMAMAVQAGAKAIFLQCAAHGLVERLYAGLDFQVVARPILVCLHPAA